MPEQPADWPPQGAAARLQELAGLLRTGSHLDPEAQRELADLMDELAKVVAGTPAPSSEATHLAESAAHVAQALQHYHDASLLTSARHRLDEAAVRAETKAPVATGIVRRILAALVDLGI